MGEQGDRVISFRGLLREAFSRLFPAFGSLINSRVGFLCSFIVFVTYVLTLTRSSRPHRGFSMEEDERAIASLLDRINNLERRLNYLEVARNKAISEGRPSRTIDTLDEVIKAEKKTLENLQVELELRQLRMEAYRMLESIGNSNILNALKEMVKRIEEGETFEEQQHEILRSFKEIWRRREVEIVALRNMLSSLE